MTPLKTTGHNSTPSISMNPAAFAASLAALKAKKKIVVSFPNERPLPDDEAVLAHGETRWLPKLQDRNLRAMTKLQSPARQKLPNSDTLAMLQ